MLLAKLAHDLPIILADVRGAPVSMSKLVWSTAGGIEGVDQRRRRGILGVAAGHAAAGPAAAT